MPKKPSDKELAAQEIAQSWLALVDEEQYAQSWEAAAGYFKQAVSVENWLQSMQAHRKPLGALVSRDVKTMKYCTSLPGAPDGEYVVIQFKTSFANKKRAIETVTPMIDADGVWRVSGYFIR